MKRTHHCDALRGKDIGSEVCLRGWVDRRRDHGGVIFIDLRDREGKTQVVFNPDFNGKTHAEAEGLRNEYVIWVKGTVKARPEGMRNPKMNTGEVDVYVSELRILGKSENPPIMVNDALADAPEGEDVRLKYRYLDLRRPREQRYIRLKSQFINAWRRSFEKYGFDDIETPILMKSTPEGARDFLSPSRLNPGKFYALPQSPQTYKQLLMIAGFEKYYQVAKCFRDEDLRADRQPEFLQFDCEMSFVECEDVYHQFEKIVSEVVEDVWGEKLETPFQRMPYEEAMLHYGSDKPDLRYELKIQDVSAIAGKTGFKVFQDAVSRGGVIRGLAATGCVDLPRRVIDDLTAFVGRYGSKGLVWMRVKDEGVETQVAKFFQPEELEQLREAVGGKPGDMLFFIAGPEKTAATAMGHLRTEIARMKNLTEGKPNKFLWVVDFPLFEYSPAEKRYYAMHHPFTSPREEDLVRLEQGELDGVKAKAYDMVLNGAEIGGGSVRIHNADLQKKMFKCLGLSDEQVASQVRRPPPWRHCFRGGPLFGHHGKKGLHQVFHPLPQNQFGSIPDGRLPLGGLSGAIAGAAHPGRQSRIGHFFSFPA